VTRLLVSVRNAAEAQTALAAGVDLIDLKEPHRGALGAVDSEIVADVLRLVDGRVPVSMALGELVDLVNSQSAMIEVPPGLRYVKAGLAGCAARASWVEELAALARSLSAQTSLVAVAYADFAEVEAPTLRSVLDAAVAVGCGAVLVDTAVKNGRTLLDHWSRDVLAGFIAEARGGGLTSVVGGSLSSANIRSVAELRPDYVAVRGAACAGPRTGTVDAARIRDLQIALAAS